MCAALELLTAVLIFVNRTENRDDLLGSGERNRARNLCAVALCSFDDTLCRLVNELMVISLDTTLKYKCTNAARFAFVWAPTEEIKAVTQVPIFCPIIIGNAVANGTCPVTQSACKMPTEADEL